MSQESAEPGRRRRSLTTVGWVLAGLLAFLVVTGSNAYYVAGIGDDRRGYLTLDEEQLILSPSDRISIGAVGVAGGYRWCETDFAEPIKASGSPDVRTILSEFCPRQADVERAAVEDPWFEVALNVSGQSTASDRRTMLALWLAQVFAIVGGALAVAQLLRPWRQGPFGPAQVRWLRVCAGFVAVGAIVVPILIYRFELMLVTRFTPRLPELIEFSPRLEPRNGMPGAWPYVLVVVLLLLTEVWRRAIALQREAEATI